MLVAPFLMLDMVPNVAWGEMSGQGEHGNLYG
jgi:hypothetical protein